MKGIIPTFFLILLLFASDLFSHTWEFGMQVIDANGSPVSKGVLLYQLNDLSNTYRETSSFDGWLLGEAINFYCDVGFPNSPNPSWPAIEPGTYRLRIIDLENEEDRYIVLNINANPPGDGDFIIKYQNEQFSLLMNNRGVTISNTKDWDLPVVFEQKKENGITNVGTVSIWNGSSFNERYSPPHQYDLIPGEDYYFDADTNVYDNQKFHIYTDLGYINYLQEYVADGSYDPIIQANFKSVSSDIHIQNQAEGVIAIGGNINFKDPWLNDFNEDPYGLRNRGSGAISHLVNSPFNPNTNSSGSGHNYKGIFLNEDPYFIQGIPNYTIQALNGNITMLGKYGTRPFYFQYWTGSGVQFEHSGNAETGVVFTSSNATATAVMKGHLLSDNSDVFGNNGQQHLVRDYNGYYHLFYVSMGKIWHTKSLTTNFDGAWSQEQVVPMEASFDTPISISVDAANVPGPDSIAIAYTDGYSLGYTTINAATNALISTRYVQTNIEYGYGAFVKPVVAYTKKELMVIYRASASGGLYCSLKYKFYDNDPWIYSENNLLPHTGFTSSYPTIAVTKTGYSGDIFHIAFQEGNLRPSIMYGQLPEGANLSFNPYPISETSGFTFNFSPSISLFYLGNNVYKPLVSWTASNSGTLNKNDSQQGNQIPEPRMICRPQNDNGAWGDVFSSGQSVNFSANNSVIRTNTRTSVIAWSQSGGTESKWVRRENSTYSGATCLEPAGLIPNISTGSDLTNIKAVSSDATTMPAVLFPAVTSFNGTPICSGNQKVMLPYTLTYSRSGVILKNGIEFVFNTGDIINSDTVVKFKEAPDTIIYNSPEELNGSLITEPFHLDQNSSLLFTNYYYVINKEAADSLLSVIDAVSFRVELVNSSTNQVAGTFDNITFSKENLDDYENVSYEIDCSGISEGEYFLRIVTSQIGDASYSLINTQNDASNMAKKSYNKVAYSGEEIPLKYDLSQNYPNPFNPAGLTHN